MRLAHRLLLYAITVITVLVIFIVGIIDRRVQGRIFDEIVSELAREARLVAVQWLPGSDADALADAAGTALGNRVTLIDSTGRVVGDSEFDGDRLRALENHSRRPEVIAAHGGARGSSRRISASTGDEELYVAVNTSSGISRVSVPTLKLDQIFVGARRDVLSAGFGALMLATVLSVVFARNVSRPISEMRDVAHAMASHDFSRPVVEAPGEVGELARTLHQLSTQIESLENMRRDFVANVSHELRTPLTIVGGFAETLVDDDPPAPIRREFAGMILTNTRRMQGIVDELLDLSRIESGGWVPNPVMVDIRTVAGEVIAATLPSAEKKSLTLRSEIPEGSTLIYADRTAIRQIVTNLVENAVRHTAAGEVVVFAEPDPHGVALGVRDTGEGIAPEHLPRIFERFYRADAGRSRDQGGTGLGLAIVRHMAEGHGGRVTAQSTLGSGTTIRAIFPPAHPSVQIDLPGL